MSSLDSVLLMLEVFRDVLPWPDDLVALQAAYDDGVECDVEEALCVVGSYLVAVGTRLADIGRAVGSPMLVERGDFLIGQGTTMVLVGEADDDDDILKLMQGLTGPGGDA